MQDFIADARSTRDLWSGSYLLSFLIAAGIRKLTEQGGTLIFPNPDFQPLLNGPETWRSLPNHQDLLTPNLFVAVFDEPDPVASQEPWRRPYGMNGERSRSFALMRLFPKTFLLLAGFASQSLRPDALTAFNAGELVQFTLLDDSTLDSYQPPSEVVDAVFMQRAHALRLKVHPWTINRVDEMQAMLDLGVDGMFTDDPAALHQLLAVTSNQ
ncbi:MAG TPA: type III-B CRISPR-associated protein Cas10/Cmr2 [Verrucomicrobiales bacterium]|nr:type III-B CRISPR-associated protein Cas10/Cmr2 [Verrucomicrobiales bacterium]